ncbi:MAG: non-canonical purine NTP pyrophosphatase [Spirochaetia bacterium]
MDILLASGNAHKLREMSAVFPKHRLLTPTDFGIEAFSPTEDAPNFHGNALIKARALHAAVLMRQGRGTAVPPILADDSGICVDALNGSPGIFSARYGSDREHAPRNDAERTALLLQDLSAVTEPTKRSAYYVCAMVLLWCPERFYCVQETWVGRITFSPSTGTGGFGYDPVFFLPDQGRTVADISPEEKNKLSHRGKAAARIAPLLDAKPTAE